MTNLDQHISELVTPFDEIEFDQESVTAEFYVQYQKESIVKSISKKTGKNEFNLFFNDVLGHLEIGQTELFLRDCMIELSRVYNIGCTWDYIQREAIIEKDQNTIISLIKYFVNDEWLDHLPKMLPGISEHILLDRSLLIKEIKENYSEIRNKIMGKVEIPFLVRHYFKYCTFNDGVKTLLILIIKDTPGVVSNQL